MHSYRKKLHRRQVAIKFLTNGMMMFMQRYSPGLGRIWLDSFHAVNRLLMLLYAVIVKLHVLQMASDSTE